jgi:hypothetical protein
MWQMSIGQNLTSPDYLINFYCTSAWNVEPFVKAVVLDSGIESTI